MIQRKPLFPYYSTNLAIVEVVASQRHSEKFAHVRHASDLALCETRRARPHFSRIGLGAKVLSDAHCRHPDL